ncbi:hypothetical protein NECAME_05830 [Necator americanus]|uniref:Chromatin assembly factor 1 subunit A n=1 Tax=Necator americanus TaxID=51031 RepID=W2TYC0_NECAM|nr:hypothetical protein NECAME_05830 [Necator americanus]ETN86838.1 hypothetical protein NECAME_05830 [Necator americanus]
MIEVDVCTKENDAVEMSADGRHGLKRTRSPSDTDPIKKSKVEEDDVTILDDNESSPKSSGRVTPSLATSAIGTVTSSKKGTPKMTKEEREAEKARKALQKKLKEEERERAKAIEEKKRRESANFMKFFNKVEKKKPDVVAKADEELWYKPFEIKDGMTLAPIQRRPILKLEEDILKQHPEVSQTSYLSSLSINPKKLIGAAVNPMRAKLYQFHDNYRPPYYGTWRSHSKVITGRRPFSATEKNIDYEVDSDAEWEEEPSDAEECKSDEEDDTGGDSDVDSDHEAFFVEPGYLSDGEGDEAEEEDVECNAETGAQHDDSRDAEERRERLAARAREWKSRVLGRKQPTVLVPRCVGPTYCAAATAASQPLAALTVVLF